MIGGTLLRGQVMVMIGSCSRFANSLQKNPWHTADRAADPEDGAPCGDAKCLSKIMLRFESWLWFAVGCRGWQEALPDVDR